jgi:hypothetical protein
MIEKAEKLAAVGLSEKQIAFMLGIVPDTLIRYKKKYADLQHAIKRGQLQAIVTVASTLYNDAVGSPAKYDEQGNLIRQERKPNTVAQIFFLKNRAGWKDVTEVQTRELPQIAIIPFGEAKTKTTSRPNVGKED